MRILYVTHAYPPHGSGVGSFVQDAARGLAARGHQVWVVEAYHPRHGKPVGNRMDEGVDVRVFGEGFLPFRWMSGESSAARTLLRVAYKTKIFFLLLLFQSWRCGRYVRRLAKELDVALVEVPDGNESGLLAPADGHAALVVRVHGSVHLQMAAGVRTFTGLERWVYKRIERSLIRRADAVVAVSAFVGRLVQKIFGWPREIPVIYNLAPVPPPGIPQTHDAAEVLFVGRIGHDKGVDTLGKAWNVVADRFPEVKLVVLGVGDNEMLLQSMAEMTRARVEFRGSLPKAQVLEHLGRCRLFVLPSRYESFSIALLEALSMGCPIIYTERCSGPEVIQNGVSGELVNPDDADTLAAAMLRILGDEGYRQRLMDGARKAAAQYSDGAAWIGSNEQFYQEVLRERRGEQ